MTWLEPAVAVTDPAQVPANPFGVATMRFAGSPSSRFVVSVAVVEFVLPRVIVRVVVAPVEMMVSPKAFDTVGGVLAGTVKTAVAAAALLPAVVLRSPVRIVFV
jgi:hypothetical protein